MFVCQKNNAMIGLLNENLAVAPMHASQDIDVHGYNTLTILQSCGHNIDATQFLSISQQEMHK